MGEEGYQEGQDTHTEEPAFVAETLAWCNERRAEKQLPPLDRLPKGKRSNPLSCPCGDATGLFVASRIFAASVEEFDNLCANNPEYMRMDENSSYPPEISLPSGVQKFVFAFDSGNLPQYELIYG